VTVYIILIILKLVFYLFLVNYCHISCNYCGPREKESGFRQDMKDALFRGQLKRIQWDDIIGYEDLKKDINESESGMNC
jgi:hypothetical protein